MTENLERRPIRPTVDSPLGRFITEEINESQLSGQLSEKKARFGLPPRDFGISGTITLASEAAEQVRKGVFDTGMDPFIAEHILDEGVLGVIRRKDGTLVLVNDSPENDVELDDYLRVKREIERLTQQAPSGE